jgi:sortase A
MDNLPRTKKILILLGIFAVVFIILDFSYLWTNLEYFLQLPSPASIGISEPKTKTQPDLLVVESLGIQAPIQYATAANETAYQAALINGVVHYPGTANPGELGNCYIFGHSSDFIWSKGHYKSIFAVLPQIKIGAEVFVSDRQGNEFIYTVTASREVSANDVSVLSQQNYQKKLLTLQTSYPVGTALARWVVIGEIKK